MNVLPNTGRKNDAKVEEIYTLGETLGKDSISEVRLATHKESQQQYAIKIMHLSGPGQEDDANKTRKVEVGKTLNMLMGLRDMYIVRTKEYFEEHDKVYLVTEYLSGGELLQAVQNRSSYTEADARWCFQQILRGIRYLHSNGVTHGDIKSANILLVKVQDIMLIKIGEFNLAKRFEEPMTSDCGTLYFKAPEIVKGKLRTCDSPAVDLWSAGVILFLLLGGSPPFYDTDPNKLQAAICAGKFSLEDSAWENISENAKDLVSKLLVVDPKKRLSAAEALAHPWFSDPNVRTVQSLPSTQSNLSASLKLLCKQKSAGSITFKELMLYSLLSLCASAIEFVETSQATRREWCLLRT